MDNPFLDDADLAPLAAPSDSALTTVAALARRQIDLEDALAANDAERKRLNVDLMQVSEVDLPAAMAAAGPSGIVKFTIGGGYEVKDELRYRAGQLDDGPDRPKRGGADGEVQRPLCDRLDAFTWLDENGHGDLPKHQITISLGRGQEDVVEDILTFLRAHRAANSMSVDRRRVVVWNTLVAFAKELDAHTLDAPLEMLGVHKGHVTRIVRPKRNSEF